MEGEGDDADAADDGKRRRERMEHMSADHRGDTGGSRREGMLQERAEGWGDILDQVSPGPLCALHSHPV